MVKDEASKRRKNPGKRRTEWKRKEREKRREIDEIHEMGMVVLEISPRWR